MKQFEVIIEETRTYKIIVEAENDEQAELAALNSEKFLSNICDDTDARAIHIDEV